MKKSWLYGIIILLILINGVLLYQNYNLKKPKKEREYLKNILIPDINLFDLDGDKINLGEFVESSSLSFVVVFSPTDCGVCLSERVLWEEVRSRHKINVLGVVYHPDKRELIQWIENQKLSIPVVWDSADQVKDALEVETSPLKLLVNSKGSVIWTDPARITNEDRLNFWKDLENVLKSSD